jgi:hypothetical protein
MDVVTGVVIVGIAKGLAKLLVDEIGGGVLAESIASELAGAVAQRKIEESVKKLVSRYVGTVEEHPEFREIPENDLEAVKFEVEQSLMYALDHDFIAKHGFDTTRILTAIYQNRGHKGEPRDFSSIAAAFYRQVMDGAIGAILVIRENAKGWKTAEARQVQSRFDEILQAIQAEAESREKINETLGLLERTVADLESKEYRVQRNFLDIYLRAIRTTLDSMELFGLEIDPKTRAKEQRLSVAYITLRLKEDSDNESGYSRSWPETLNTLDPERKNRLLVRGDAGMGKTTLLRWGAIATASPITQSPSERLARRLHRYFYRTAQTSSINRDLSEDVGVMVNERVVDSLTFEFKTGFDLWRDKIPLLVILRDCREGHFPKPSEFPAQLSAAVGDPPERFIEWLLDHGKALVMIDGVDEVPPGVQGDSINKGISDLLSVYGEKGNLFIVTSRPMQNEPAWLKNHNFAVADVSPMTRSDRDSLIRKWHTAYGAQLPTEEERSAFANKAEVLIRELDARPAVARVATTPLLCAMLCAQCGALNYTLPGSEWQIIEGLCHALLWRRDKERALPATGTIWDDLEYPQRRDIAARLAKYMVDENKTVVDKQTANITLAHALTWIGRDQSKATAEAEVIRERLSARGGILRVTKSGALEFVHNTFKEFLSASVYSSQWNIEFLAANAPREDCANVCRFAAACASHEYTKQLIEAVLKKSDRPTARKLISVRMTAAASSLDPQTRAEVKKIEKVLFPPKSDATCKALAELGNEVLDKLRHSVDMSIKAQTMCVLTLTRIATPEARAAMIPYALNATDQNLIEQLCRGISPIDVPAVRRALTQSVEQRTIELTGEIRQAITDSAITDWLRKDTGFHGLTTLDLGGSQLTDSGLKELARADTPLVALDELEISSTQVTDAGLKELARPNTGLKMLTALNLNNTRVTETGLKELAHPDSGLKSLTLLDVGNILTDSALKELSALQTALRALDSLYVYGAPITDSGIKELARHDTGLKALDLLLLLHTEVTDAGLRELTRPDTGLKALQNLYLDGKTFTDMGLRELARPDTGLKALSLLSLSGANFTNNGLRELSRPETGARNLKTLYLYGNNWTDASLKQLSHPENGLANLDTLHLMNTQVTNVGLMQLTQPDMGLKALHRLRLQGLDVTDTTASALKKSHIWLSAGR